jgi:hypothetical protein
MTTEQAMSRLVDTCERTYGHRMPALRALVADMLDDVNAARVASLKFTNNACLPPIADEPCDCVNRPAHGRCTYPNC